MSCTTLHLAYAYIGDRGEDHKSYHVWAAHAINEAHSTRRHALTIMQSRCLLAIPHVEFTLQPSQIRADAKMKSNENPPLGHDDVPGVVPFIGEMQPFDRERSCEQGNRWYGVCRHKYECARETHHAQITANPSEG